MSATSTIPKRETVQHFTVNTEATSALSRVGQSSVFGVGQMPSFGDTTQTQISDSSLDMLEQYMCDELMCDVGGEATGEQTIPRTITTVGLTENMLLPFTTNALPSLEGGFDTNPFQSDGVPIPIMQQVSTGNSLPESLHEAGKEIKPLALN